MTSILYDMKVVHFKMNISIITIKLIPTIGI
jgi:hypothetical protein